MKVGIYLNPVKDPKQVFLNQLIGVLEGQKIEYVILSENDGFSESVDALFVLGGDGTILYLTEKILKLSAPVIGINVGKLGFLTEFEPSEMEDAVKMLKSKTYKEDARSVCRVESDGDVYYALNDVVIERLTTTENQPSKMVAVSTEINGDFVEKYAGDGVILSTPTGSTAYQLSAGGAILAPQINAFEITPICAHTLHNRPIVYNADLPAVFTVQNDVKCGLFIDGKYVKEIKNTEKITVTTAKNPIVFLRKSDSNFYRRLIKKLGK